MQTLKHGDSLMMFSKGTGQLIAITGIMKSEDYIKILDENVWLSVQNLDLGWWFNFQQDNDPKHTFKSVTTWLEKNKITVLLWPLMSPDLNPIENLWIELKVGINCWSPKTLLELECVTIEGWKKIPEKTCSNLIKNFRKWLQKVIKMRSHVIDY